MPASQLADRFIEFQSGPYTFRARLLSESAPTAAQQVWDLVPRGLEFIHDEWSGFIFRSTEPVSGLSPAAADVAPPYQYPGLVLAERVSRRIAICYGQARLQDGYGPLEGVPIAEIGGDLTPLESLGRRLEREGIQDVVITRSDDQDSPLEPPPLPAGRRVEVRLGSAAAVARLLEESAPVTTAAFLRMLPIVGTATNIPLNGPLVRLRTPGTSPADPTIIESDEKEFTHTILYPGYVYYRGGHPAGIRIAREATTMYGRGGVSTMSTIPFVPLGRFESDWSALRAEAARLFVDGEKPLSFHLLDD
jgi:hypothetical protein